MHYVAELNSNRADLPEHRKYHSKKFEVQIRSILQHAWAEIEHDLGYKSQAAIPRAVRRRFSRLAGLLELADEEFAGIRGEIGEHQAVAHATIGQGSFGIEIDQDSLIAFVQSSPRIAQLDRLIAEYRHSTVQKHVDQQFLDRQVGQLGELGFQSIRDVSSYLDARAGLLARFIKQWLSRTEQTPRLGRVPVPVGIALYYAGALRYAEESEAGAAGDGYAGTSADLLREALRAARSDTGSPG